MSPGSRRGSARRYVPDRGDAVWLTFDPHTGHEQAGHRPAVVLSPRAYNERVGLALVCPITSAVKGYPFEVALAGRGQMNGAILADQVKSLDWRARKARHLGTVSPAALAEVIAKVELLLRG